MTTKISNCIDYTIFKNQDIESIFDGYPKPIREKCLILRELIFEVASQNPLIGPIEETLRWGEPSFIPTKTKSGSMIRIHHYDSKPFDFAMYFICNTTLVDTFREEYPDTFQFNGNRALEFMLTDELPISELKNCIQKALTYYLN